MVMFKNPKSLPTENKDWLSKSKTFESYSKSNLKSLKIESYFAAYDEIFKKYVGKKIIFVEIGVLHGGSLEMWKNYFGGQARIIGIDINPEAKKLESKGFEIFIGSQSSKKFWDTFYEKIGPVDIVLDDGGHQNNQQIITAYESIKNINDGGVLVTEDTHTSYLPKFGNPSKYSFINFAKNKIDKINYRFPEFKNKDNIEKKIFSINFYESIVAFNINSENSIIPNYLENNGNSFTNEDLWDGSFTEFFPKIQKLIDGKFKILKNIPVLKKIIRILFYKKNFIVRFKENLSLKRYFK
jgi:cephalosporin hydroxylase